MNIIDRLMPAVREARIPLLVGYGYLLAGWLVFYELLPTSADEIRSGSSIDAGARLLGSLSVVAELSLLTVSAYLLGTLTGVVWDVSLRSPDDAVLTDQAKQGYAESRLRLQLSLPVSLIVVTLAIRDGNLLWLLLAAVPFLLLAHGVWLWRQAAALPARRDLAESDLAQSYLRGVNLQYADLRGADLRAADLTALTNRDGQVRRRANLRDVALGEARTGGLRTFGAEVDGPAIVALVRGGVALDGVRGDDVTLRDASLDHATITGASLHGADLTGAVLLGADLTFTDLRDAVLAGADLAGSSLRNSDLAGADLSDATLRDIDIAGASFDGADLSRAALEGAQLSALQARGSVLEQSHLAGAHLARAELRGAQASGVDLSEADLLAADLRDANLEEADLTNSKCVGAALRGAALRGATLVGVDLRAADLTNADLTGADLTNARLEGADLEGAVLEGADLTGVDLDATSHPYTARRHGSDDVRPDDARSDSPSGRSRADGEETTSSDRRERADEGSTDAPGTRRRWLWRRRRESHMEAPQVAGADDVEEIDTSSQYILQNRTPYMVRLELPDTESETLSLSQLSVRIVPGNTLLPFMATVRPHLRREELRVQALEEPPSATTARRLVQALAAVVAVVAIVALLIAFATAAVGWVVAGLANLLVLSTLPAAAFAQFRRNRLSYLRDQWVRDIFSLNRRMITLSDVNAAYGATMDRQLAGLSGGGRLLGGGSSPMVVCTLVLAIGWALVLAIDELFADPGPLAVSYDDPAAFAFLGAYFFGIDRVVRGYITGTLGFATYNRITIRVVTTVATTVLVAAVLPDRPPFTTGLSLVAFALGIMPFDLATIVRRLSTALPGRLGAPGPDGAPLVMIDGLHTQDRIALERLGIDTADALASCDVVTVMIDARVLTARLVNWVDQAILISVLGSPVPRGLVERLQAIGMRTASDLVTAAEQSEESAGYLREIVAEHPPRGIRPGTGPTGREQETPDGDALSQLLVAARTQPAMHQVLNWNTSPLRRSAEVELPSPASQTLDLGR